MPVPGEAAPAFALRNQHGEVLTQADLLGAPALLVFFPLVLTPVCEQELADLAARQPTWDALGVHVVGLSVDHRYSLREAADRIGVRFDLLSDFWPHGETARAYGSFDHERGHALRRSFVLDPRGVVTRVLSTDRLTPRDPDAYETALAAAG